MNQREVSRRKFISSVAAAGAGTAAGKNVSAQKRPEFTGPLTTEKLPDSLSVSKSNGLNLIFIIADTWRWDHLSFNSSGRIKTPNLEKLAESGVYFENCYTDGLPTIPARRVIHTGKSVLTDTRGWWHPLDKDDVTLAQVLGKADFTTGFLVDTFHHFKENMNFHRGFSSFRWIRGQESDAYVAGPKNSVNPDDHVPPHLINDYYRERIRQYVLNTKDRKSESDYFCAQTCMEGMRWLEENKDNDGPFMLFLDMFDPHEPWDAPPRFQKMYRKKYPVDRYIFGYGVRNEDIREEDYPAIRDLYAAEVTFSDLWIGKLIDKVKALGLWDNTIILFSTDHGTHLGEDGCVQKQASNMKSCLTRIPLIIRHPDKSTEGKRVSQFVSHMDFMPSCLAMLGVEGHSGMTGSNMWDLVEGNIQKLRDYTVSGYGNFASVHTDKWHFHRNFRGKNPGHGPALFNIVNDPGETRNVIDSNPSVAADFVKIIETATGRKIEDI